MGYEPRKYAVTPYRPEWAEKFTREAALVKQALGGDALYVEHVGGTAVPGLSSRPVVDLLVTVKNPAGIDRYAFSLKAIGYEPLPDRFMGSMRSFAKDITYPHGVVERHATLHVFPEEHTSLLSMIDTREYLLAHPEEVKHLDELKRRAFAKHQDDCAGYRRDRDEYLEALAKRAAKWRGRHEEEDIGAVL